MFYNYFQELYTGITKVAADCLMTANLVVSKRLPKARAKKNARRKQVNFAIYLSQACQPIWKKTLNGQLKNLEFIAKTLRHAHNSIKFVSIPIQANVEHYFIALLPISNCLWRFPSNTESLFANINFHWDPNKRLSWLFFS